MTLRRTGFRNARGFTLIELIVVMVIAGVLAAIAIPNYQEYVLRSRRADAQGFMMEVAARQQHFLVDRRAYSASITDAPAAGGLGMTIPARVANFYNVTFTPAVDNTANPPTYTISAAPTGVQVGDRCGTLGLAQNGARSASGGAGCW
jgi:type IV pilus assembly protein PilE